MYRTFGWTGIASALALTAACTSPEPPRMTYPVTRTVDHVDTYHGVSVPDPYRWLEDDTSADTAAWVEAQNAVTFAHLETIPFRGALAARLEELFNYPKFGEPFRRGSTYFFFKNDGLQNQAVVYRQTGLDGAPEVLLDPNTLSPDGTTKLSVFAVSRDGRRAVYGLSVGGSDWQTYKVLDVATRQPLSDSVEWVKVSGAAWAGDGFFYSRYPAPEKGKELSTKNVEPRGVLPSPRHAAVGRRAGVLRPGQPRALPHRRDHRGRAVSRPHGVGPRQGQEGQRRLLPGSAGQGHDLPSDRRRDRRRHLQRGRQRRRPLPGAHRPQGAQRPGVPLRPEDPGRERVEGRPSGAARAARRRRYRRRQAVCQLPEGRHLARLRVRPRRHARARNRAARPRHRVGPGGTRRRRRDLLHLHLVQLPADDLQVRREVTGVLGVPRRRHPRLRRRRLRGAAGVRHREGRRPGADVPHLQEGADAERRQPDADVRLRRLQRHAVAGLQRAAHRAARTGRGLRLGQPARRQRVRRGLARGRHQAEEAERLRRLHRRRRVADRQQVHVAREAGDDRWHRTVACWWGRS